MDTVQALRRRASAAGNLSPSAQMQVREEGGSIALEPVSPELAYVPYYDPQTIYGPWWWPAYPPVYWPAWPGYIVRPGLPFGSVWGVGVAISAGFFFGAFDWHRRHVNIVHVDNFYYRPGRVNAAPGPWQHDVDHRRGVPYRGEAVRQQFNRPFAPAAPVQRSEFRGHQAPFAAAPVRPAAPVAAAPARPTAPVAAAPAVRPQTRFAAPEPPPRAFEGIRAGGSQTRQFSARGQASLPPRAAPAPALLGACSGTAPCAACGAGWCGRATQVNAATKLATGILCALLFFVAAAWAQTGTPAQRIFQSPEAGAAGAVEALKANDEAALREILGRRGADLIGLREPSAGGKPHERFLAAYAESNKLVPEGADKAVLEVGTDAWPFPIPLVRAADGWRFDARLGEQEVLARRVGRNELAAIQVCLAIGEAEREYASAPRDKVGVLKYTPRMVSTPGRHDGLYWETADGEPLSPLGPFVAAAGADSAAGRATLRRGPYHGYYYRILTRQGKNAKGGAYSYVVHGAMIGGFAVLAYPARYGYTGVKVFMVSRDGEVFEKDLGKNTQAISEKLQALIPTRVGRNLSLPG